MTAGRSLIAVLELRYRAWEAATGECVTDRTVEVRRRAGERLELELALAPAPLGFAVSAVSEERIAIAADAELPVAVSPAAAVDPAARVLELALGDRVRLAAPDRASTCELRLVAIRSVDARTMPGGSVRDVGAFALAQVRFSRLRRLALASCSIARGGALGLLQSTHLARLRHLRLHENALGDAGAVAIARSRMRSIEDLDLQACAIGDVGVSELAGSSNARALRRWRLGGNPIGDAGARAIAESIHTRALTHLDLARCRVGDEGAVALAASASPALALALAQNPIGDAGAAALIASPIGAVTLSAEPLSAAMRGRVRERFGDDALSARPPRS